MRIDYTKVAPEGLRALYGFQNYISRHSSLDARLLHLVELRCSQINGCAFCMRLHSLQLREMGEEAVRMDSLSAWEETDLFTDRERAALAWAESVTRVGETHVPDDVYEQVRAQFEERELVDLTLAIGLINTWNRVAIGFRQDPKQAEAVLSMARETAAAR